MALSWFGWVFVATQGLLPLLVIARIGKARPPLTSTDAIVSVIISGLLIWGAVAIGTRT